jgi:hypothetical protein
VPSIFVQDPDCDTHRVQQFKEKPFYFLIQFTQLVHRRSERGGRAQAQRAA